MSITNNQGLGKSKDENETDRLVKQYLKQGGTITQCEADATTPDIENSYGWGKRKPQAKAKQNDDQ